VTRDVVDCASAKEMRAISSPKTPTDDSNDAPKSYFEWELRKISRPEDKGETYINRYPPLPSSSPWAVDVVGKEPSVDRSMEDGLKIDNQE
jgi:hypothetical protein